METKDFLSSTSLSENNLTHTLQQFNEQITHNWFNLARKSISIPLSDEELKAWLTKYLFAFIEYVQDPSSRRVDAVLSDFASLLQDSGVTLANVMEVVFLLSHAVELFGLEQIQNGSVIDQESVAELRTLILHGMAHSAESYFYQAAQETQRQQERTATLLRVAKAASSSLDLEKVIRTISKEIVQALDALDCSSFLFPDQSKYGQYFLLDPVPPPNYVVPDPPELFGLDALQRGEPVICYDAALDPRTDKETVRFFGLKSLMAFPLISNGKTVAAGLIAMKDYHNFTQEEIDLVMGIANATAIAIENAQMFEKTKRLAIMEERNRLSMEMHDNLAQALAVIKMGVNSLLQEEVSDSAREILLEMKSLANETYIDLRDTIFGLRAINESDTQFLDNFKNYLATFGIHSGLDIQFSIPEEYLNLLSKEAVLQVGRILEEALSNVRKHAAAQQVWIESGKTGKTLWITVQDDGVGIHPERTCGSIEGHFGIRVMTERAESIGGRLWVSNRPAGGTCVKLEVPIEQ